MALFGRRKPGFAKEVELKPSDMPGEFSDALDPAMHKAQETAEAAAQSAAPQEDKPDLLDFLQTLPEVNDPFPPSEPDPAPYSQETVDIGQSKVALSKAAFTYNGKVQKPSIKTIKLIFHGTIKFHKVI